MASWQARTTSFVLRHWFKPPLYLHGGGYFACTPRTYRPVTGFLAREVGTAGVR